MSGLNRYITSALFGIVLNILVPLTAAGEPIEIFVSILPQKNFVERIGGDQVNVYVMVGPGQSPATYEPTPKQMIKLAAADVYFRIGTPFEKVWMNRIKTANPGLAIIDARDNITLREMEQGNFLSAQTAAKRRHKHGLKDPHIWTDPLNVKTFMRYFTDKLSVLYPEHKTLFTNNFRQFASELDDLDSKIQAVIHNAAVKHVLVFHPSWGYFTDRYGLTQIPIELSGKTPNAKELAAVIDYAKHHNIKRIFTQKQFSQKDAQAVAKAIDGTVIAVDPLAEDYVQNLLTVARRFAGGVQ